MIAASDLKQNSMRLQDALRDDLLVTKRDKPFVVVMDFEKYKLIKEYIRLTTDGNISKENIENALRSSGKKELNLTIFSRGKKQADFNREDAYSDSF